jgi:hypothetical protein
VSGLLTDIGVSVPKLHLGITIQSPIRNPLRYLLMLLLAKEIFKNTVIHASMIPAFYENCLGSE